MSSRTTPKGVVLMGEPSAEREVSLASGCGCAVALRCEGSNVVKLGAGQGVAGRPHALASVYAAYAAAIGLSFGAFCAGTVEGVSCTR